MEEQGCHPPMQEKANDIFGPVLEPAGISDVRFPSFLVHICDVCLVGIKKRALQLVSKSDSTCWWMV